jgi:hypothetical protein
MKNTQEKEIESLKDKVSTLWNRLDVSPDERGHIIDRTAKKECGKSILKIVSMMRGETCDQVLSVFLASISDFKRIIVKNCFTVAKRIRALRALENRQYKSSDPKTTR